jgi:hypothetical protein
MIPVNVLSDPTSTLVVSVGPRPANSRPANSTREYEPGSGDRHDPAPVHHPHPARSPPAVVGVAWEYAAASGAAPPTSRVLRIADATDLRSALDPGASTSPSAANAGQVKDTAPPTGVLPGHAHHSLRPSRKRGDQPCLRCKHLSKIGQPIRTKRNAKPETVGEPPRG